MLKFTHSSEDINSNGCFSFVERLLSSNKAMGLWDSLRLLPATRNLLYTISAIVRYAVGLMAVGEPTTPTSRSSVKTRCSGCSHAMPPVAGNVPLEPERPL